MSHVWNPMEPFTLPIHTLPRAACDHSCECQYAVRTFLYQRKVLFLEWIRFFLFAVKFVGLEVSTSGWYRSGTCIIEAIESTLASKYIWNMGLDLIQLHVSIAIGATYETDELGQPLEEEIWLNGVVGGPDLAPWFKRKTHNFPWSKTGWVKTSLKCVSTIFDADIISWDYDAICWPIC